MTRPETKKLKAAGVHFTTYSDTYKDRPKRRITIELHGGLISRKTGRQILVAHGYKWIRNNTSSNPFHIKPLEKFNRDKLTKNVPRRRKK